MSLHQIHSDVEEGEVFVVSPSSDVQRHSHTELMEYPSYTSSRSSNPAVIAINSENPTSKEKVHAKSWDHVTSFFVDWWVRAVNLFVDWWMGELLAILLSIITLFAIIYVLRKHDGHNLPTFPHNVSLNFIVSTLATVSKSSLLFAVASALGQFKWLWMFSKQRRLQDLQVFYDASRGPLGSSRLLASRKSLSWASIGAVVTILCLIYDPFIQGLIKVSGRVVYKDSPASLVHKLKNYPYLDRSLSADYALIGTISNAAFNPNPLSETQPRCSTGDCTWPPFTSLGFCFKCQDISQAVQNSSTHDDRREKVDPNPDHRGGFPGMSNSPRRDNHWKDYTYTFPELNGQVLQSLGTYSQAPQRSISTRFDMDMEDPRFFAMQLYWDPATPFNFNDGTSVPTVSLLIFIRTSAQNSDPGAVVAADLCALSFCAQKRTVSVSLDQPTFTVLQTVNGIQNVQIKPGKEGYGTDPDLKKRLSFIGDDFNTTFPETNGEIDPSNWVNNLRDLLSTFEGKLVGQVVYKNDPKAISNMIGALNASSNISMTMNNIATAMTNHFRDSSNNTIVGQASQTELFVDVTWPWITLPAILVLAGFIFLMLAMFETKRLGASIWKTSELALLFHGSEESYADLQELLDRCSEMESVALGIRTQMVKSSSGKWVLRREKP